MMRLSQSMPSYSYFFIAAFGILTLMNCSSVHSSESISKENNTDSSNNEDYWTPERLKEAKPLELPHPTAPPSKVPVPPHESAPSQPPSFKAPGHEGEEDIPLDETNLLFENGQTP